MHELPLPRLRGERQLSTPLAPTSALPVAAAVAGRTSHPRVDPGSPSREELLPLIEAAASVADHGSLRPWRLIALRGEALARLGSAFIESAGATGNAAEKLASRPLRAELLLAIVASHKPSPKVETWEQDAAAAGVAHALSLLLDEAGWGVMWRTGPHTRTEPVRTLHALTESEQLLGWLYVGRPQDNQKTGRKKTVDVDAFLTEL